VTTQLFGEGSRERHARESSARAGKDSGISRESIRQFKVIKALAPDLIPSVTAGYSSANRISVNAAYREVIGEDRRPLYMQLPAWLDDELRAFAAQSGKTRQAFILALLESFFTDAAAIDCEATS
jgi:hypothetical protein